MTLVSIATVSKNRSRRVGVLLVHSRVIFRGYMSEDLVSEDDNRGKVLGCVECTRTRSIFPRLIFCDFPPSGSTFVLWITNEISPCVFEHEQDRTE